MTKYRIRQNGLGDKWLEYKSGLSWCPVPTPYYDNIYGRQHCGIYMGGWLAATYDAFFENWIKRYPDINVYLKTVYQPKQDRLEKEVAEFWKEYNEKKERVKYL